ncbi:MAG: SDR family NAD(P)-dependent oxidoreductase [Calditrichaeota bacterium]|nr:SDR family NAD(P)-dependent oxidoreductase [Calditrichota bacterium]
MSTIKEKWTSDNIPDLDGKVIIVTGGNSGLGFETVKLLAQKGAEVVLACRSVEKGEAAKSTIGKIKGQITVMKLDLASLENIKEFVNRFKAKYKRLDILFNNAGIMTTPYGLTKDGLEQQQGVNHFGHFALTALLFDLLKATKGSRVVNTSSTAHKFGKMDFSNLLYENGKGYTPMNAYRRSKLENLLFTYEMQRRIEKEGFDIKVLAAHPGTARTEIGRYAEKQLWFKLFKPLIMLATHHSAYDGALSQIRAGVDADAKGGEYYGPDGFMEQKGNPVVVKSNEASHNEQDAEQLWIESEKLTGVTFDIQKITIN